jgi:hypothetical protein
MNHRYELMRSLLNAGTNEDFCTLPTPARPLRVAEFEELLRDQIAGPRWLDKHFVEFTFDDAGNRYDQLNDLVTREMACCPFFDFSITKESGVATQRPLVMLRVGVPASRHDVLEALTSGAVEAWTELSHAQ